MRGLKIELKVLVDICFYSYFLDMIIMKKLDWNLSEIELLCNLIVWLPFSFNVSMKTFLEVSHILNHVPCSKN